MGVSYEGAGPLRLARVMAGEGASDEKVAEWLYRVILFEHRLWYGDTKPFPPFEEWMLSQLSVPAKSCEQETE